MRARCGIEVLPILCGIRANAQPSEHVFFSGSRRHVGIKFVARSMFLLDVDSTTCPSGGLLGLPVNKPFTLLAEYH